MAGAGGGVAKDFMWMKPGVLPVMAEFLDDKTGRKLATARTVITVS
jgi:hypothetical protein